MVTQHQLIIVAQRFCDCCLCADRLLTHIPNCGPILAGCLSAEGISRSTHDLRWNWPAWKKPRAETSSLDAGRKRKPKRRWQVSFGGKHWKRPRMPLDI